MVDAKQWISVSHFQQEEVGDLSGLEQVRDWAVVHDHGVVVLGHQLEARVTGTARVQCRVQRPRVTAREAVSRLLTAGSVKPGTTQTPARTHTHTHTHTFTVNVHDDTTDGSNGAGTIRTRPHHSQKVFRVPGNIVCRLHLSPNRLVAGAPPRTPLGGQPVLPRPSVTGGEGCKPPPQNPTPFGARNVCILHSNVVAKTFFFCK